MTMRIIFSLSVKIAQFFFIILGPDLVKRMRKDLARTFGAEFLDYVYHCNARNPT